MPKRNDLNKILLIGSGPIVIGQACEFDYSGVQACKALREEGYQVVLVNSNPATIMTDPEMADSTYVEPLTVEVLTAIIEKEKPDALLPTMGGQTGLNLAMELSQQGVLKHYGVDLLGATEAVINKAEDRDLFKQAMQKIGLKVPESEAVHSLEDAKRVAKKIGYPCVVRSAFTLGGKGGGIVHTEEALESVAIAGIENSRISEILIEKSIVGWKEFELEVMRDYKDNVVIVCSIENLDPMGTHTGDSITVAPIQTLTDKEYQSLRDAAKAIIREIGVETGGSNIQFATHPQTGEMIVIEMNPRVSRSSALASKATGFPIAKLAAKLAVGYSLDELGNDITQCTPASFEPTLDYCVVKIPKFNFEKFHGTSSNLGVSMKSVGEVMALGRTFKEALQKALRSLENKQSGFGFSPRDLKSVMPDLLMQKLTAPNPDRLSYIDYALRNGFSVSKLYSITHIDPWFLNQLLQIIEAGKAINYTEVSIESAKKMGFSDQQLAFILGHSETEVRTFRKNKGILPTYKLVDTCGGEFEAQTPYFYSAYETEDESRQNNKPKVMILGGGPNRIGQGIEFDYCCVHAAMAAKEAGFESIMVNSNPETVSTDFDSSDKLYFEPLTLEDVLNIYDIEKPEGVIIQFGGQTPLNLAKQLVEHGVTILGTSYDAIDLAEDRDRFNALIERLSIRQPKSGMASKIDDALVMAKRIGYPILLRPSYVLGGAAMEIVYSDTELVQFMAKVLERFPDSPVLIDQYLEDAIELDVDAVSDGKDVLIAGIMEHIEEAGVHSGDSACVLPPHSVNSELILEINTAVEKVAKALNVIGLLNIQFAIKNDDLYILEVNPRGSRTVPFVSKATGMPWAKISTQVILGQSLESLDLRISKFTHISVKEAVFPFSRFPESDTVLGPEMKSTGEVMGIDRSFGAAFLKSQLAVGYELPTDGAIFISVKDKDKARICPIVRELVALGFSIYATHGTAAILEKQGIPNKGVNKVSEGGETILDYIKKGDINLVINTPSGKNPRKDEMLIRQQSYAQNIPIVTTISGARAMSGALSQYINNKITVDSLQDYKKAIVSHEVVGH